jgi:hypothetical protein
MSIEAMKQAVEAFEHIKKYVTDDGAMPENWDAYHEKEYYALEALRQAIEQAEKQEKLCKYCGGIGRVVCDGRCMPEQEPVAWMYKNGIYMSDPSNSVSPEFAITPLYTASPKREQAEKPDAWIESVCALLRQAHDTLSLASLPTKREWVGLTEEECDEIWGECLGVFDCLKMTEAKLKEKNNG